MHVFPLTEVSRMLAMLRWELRVFVKRVEHVENSSIIVFCVPALCPFVAIPMPLPIVPQPPLPRLASNFTEPPPVVPRCVFCGRPSQSLRRLDSAPNLQPASCPWTRSKELCEVCHALVRLDIHVRPVDERHALYRHVHRILLALLALLGADGEDVDSEYVESE